MYEMIKEQGIFALELKTPYSPVIHNKEVMGNLLFLDGKFCSAELMNQMESALKVLLDMKQGVN